MTFSRRKLIAAAAAAIPATLLARYALSDAHSAIVAVLHKRLGYLKLDPEGVQNFARDAIERNDVAPAKLRAATATGLLAIEPDPIRSPKVLTKILYGEDRVVTQFLLGSDFFVNGADQTRVVRYLGPYDGRAHPCGNWFAQFPDVDGGNG